MFYCFLLSLFDFYWIELNSQLIPIVSLSEIISVIDYTVSSKNVDVFSDCEVSRRVELLFFQTHSWIYSVYSFLG